MQIKYIKINWLVKIAIIFMVVFLFIPTKAFASSESIDVYGRLDTDIDKINELTNYLDNTKDATDVMASKMPSYISYFQESSKFYGQFISSTDQKIATASKQSKVNSAALATDITQISDALKNQDQEKYKNSVAKFNSEINNYNKTYKSLNEGATNYNPFFIFATIFFSLISLILLIQAKTSPIYPSEVVKKECEMELFKSSLWPTIGSIITLVWYKLTPPGGTFYILWGPMLIGFIYFIKQYWAYLKDIRPHLKKAIRQDIEEFLKRKQIEEEESHHCLNCGAELVAEANFCEKCGAKINKG